MGKDNDILVGIYQRFKIGRNQRVTQVTVAEGETATSLQFNGDKTNLEPVLKIMRDNAKKQGKVVKANDGDLS